MQFRDLKEKARKRFVVLYSDIHGRGLFARCDMEKGEMLIEYAGEVKIQRHTLVNVSLLRFKLNFVNAVNIGDSTFLKRSTRKIL